MLANFSNLITFSRGSNATVTDASGRLTYAPHNLVTNSQDFEASAWTKTNTTITANASVAPDGTTTADRFNATSAGGVDQTVSLVSGATYILSVWAKSNGAAKDTFVLYGDGNQSSSAFTATSTWQRFSYLFTSANTGNRGNGIYTSGGNPSDILIWGVQLERVTYQTTPSPYVSTSVANLLGFSEDFTNAAWTKQRASIVPNAAQNPINNLWNAQKLMEDTTASNTHRLFGSITTTAIPYTLSVYMKAGERNWAYLRLDRSGGTTAVAWFNLSTGAVGTVQTGLTASIQSVGNGWYRCSATIDAAVAGAGNPLIGVTTANGTESYTGDGNSGIYIYGAQLSNSGSLDPYVPTPGAAPSSTAYYGPRFDYDPVTLAAKGILIEEQRTNLFTYSEDLSNAAWSKTQLAVSTAAGISPAGTNTANSITPTAVSAQHFVHRGPSGLVSGQPYTLTLRVKANGYRWLRIGLDAVAVVSFDAQTGTVGITTGTSTRSVRNIGNGWFEIAITWTASSTSQTVAVSVNNADSDSTLTFAGDGTSGVLLWGAQLEAGAFATSYIPTVASQVTRTADVASITGSLFSQWYNGTQGSFVVEASSAVTKTSGVFSIEDGTTINRTQITLNSAAQPTLTVVKANVSQVAISQTAVTPFATFKASAAYRENDFALSSQNLAAVTDTSGEVPTAVNQAQIGARFSSDFLNGHIRTITYYPTRLTDSQLQAITK